MRRKLIVIGCVAAAALALWIWCLLPAADLGREEDLGGFRWIIFGRMAIPYVGIWLGIGSLLIRKRMGIWAGIVAGVVSLLAGSILMNGLFLFALKRAPLGLILFGLTTGCLVWRIASSESEWFGEAA
jgi:hypothetical protein